ncbi:MAG: flagellar assembly protein FliH [Gallionellaceae bacterium]
MSDLLTPKDQLTAYERWELPSFDADSDMRVSGNPNGIKLPTAAELENIQIQAHDEGFQTGYQEGYNEGAQLAAEETRKLTALVSSMEQALKNVNQQVTQSLLDLSLELAQQMLHQVLKVQPEVLLDIIRDAISTLPHFNPGAHIVLHPSDAEIVRARMGEHLAHSGWKIFEDAQITPGGARIETTNSQIDATVETRWKRITSNIGQDSSWLPK